MIFSLTQMIQCGMGLYLDNMQNEIQRLVNALTETYSGEPWYGEGFLEKLDSINWKLVSISPVENSTTIARLVKHIINWRIFLIEKLQGNAGFDIKIDAPNDWTDIVVESESDWEQLLVEMVESQNAIIRLLKEKTDEILDTQVEGRTYSYRFLIEGIIQHDVYHLGQIGLIASQLKKEAS